VVGTRVESHIRRWGDATKRVFRVDTGSNTE